MNSRRPFIGDMVAIPTFNVGGTGCHSTGIPMLDFFAPTSRYPVVLIDWDLIPIPEGGIIAPKDWIAPELKPTMPL